MALLGIALAGVEMNVSATAGDNNKRVSVVSIWSPRTEASVLKVFPHGSAAQTTIEDPQQDLLFFDVNLPEDADDALSLTIEQDGLEQPLEKTFTQDGRHYVLLEEKMEDE
jgi:hypothetical protein